VAVWSPRCSGAVGTFSTAIAARGKWVVLERSMPGQPHKGKVLLALQAHSDDVPLMASGTVAKLIEEGYTGYLVRATNDDMGDAVGLGTPGPAASTRWAMSGTMPRWRGSWVAKATSTSTTAITAWPTCRSTK